MPRGLVVEFVGTPSGVRVGLWVPPTLSPDAVADSVLRCWPGARTALLDPPTLGAPDRTGRHRLAVTAVHVVARGGAWAPLLDPGRAPRELRAGEVDPLHGVLDTLAERPPGQTAVVQLCVEARPGRHGGRRGTTAAAVVARLVADGLTGLLRLFAALLLEVVDILTFSGRTSSQPTSPRHGAARHISSGPASPLGSVQGRGRAPSMQEDPVEAARRRDLAAKQARGPHLYATLRLAVTSGTVASGAVASGAFVGGGRGSRWARVRAVESLVNGYDLAAPSAVLFSRPVRRAARAVAQRWPARARQRLFLTVAEAAALWHLPDEPTRYGITDSRAQIRRPRRDLPRLHPREADPAAVRSGTSYPGTSYPGTSYPGTSYPGTSYPGTSYPATATRQGSGGSVGHRPSPWPPHRPPDRDRRRGHWTDPHRSGGQWTDPHRSSGHRSAGGRDVAA